MLDVLELFSGIGGISYALREFSKPVCFIEIDSKTRQVISKRHPDVPIFEDVRSFDATSWVGNVDIITAGWPCTGFSTAGKGEGFSHQASGLFTEVVRIVSVCLPRIVFLENSHVLHKQENESVIINAFDKLGYDVKTMTCRATDVGAWHQRHRWFCMAIKRNCVTDIVFPKHERFNFCIISESKQLTINSKDNISKTKMLGNAVVPEQVYYAFYELYSSHRGLLSSYVPHPCPPLNIRLLCSKSVTTRDTMLKEDTVKRYYSTLVRNSSPCGAKCLTRRTSKMLVPQIQFESGGSVYSFINSRWLCHFMGYPVDYLD